jgi:hypothetical protein
MVQLGDVLLYGGSVAMLDTIPASDYYRQKSLTCTSASLDDAPKPMQWEKIWYERFDTKITRSILIRPVEWKVNDALLKQQHHRHSAVKFDLPRLIRKNEALESQVQQAIDQASVLLLNFAKLSI